MSIHVMDRLEQAYTCVQQLLTLGCTVLSANTNLFEPKPMIEIAEPVDGTMLRKNGTPTVEVDDKGKPEQWTVAVMGGCRIRWKATPISDNSILPKMG